MYAVAAASKPRTCNVSFMQHSKRDFNEYIPSGTICAPVPLNSQQVNVTTGLAASKLSKAEQIAGPPKKMKQ